MATRRACIAAIVTVLIAPAIELGAQPDVRGGPLTGPPVINSPFSAIATTTVRQTLADGTRIDRIATARYYRDRLGRVRVEQTLLEPEAAGQPGGHERITIHPDPSSGAVYTLNLSARTVALGARDLAGILVGGGNTFVLPFRTGRFLLFDNARSLRSRYPDATSARVRELGLVPEANARREALGRRTIEGVNVMGDRVTMTFADLATGADVEVVDERWESEELELLLRSRLTDSRYGFVEYRLSGIRRSEPEAELFTIPASYSRGGPNDEGHTMTIESAHNIGSSPAARRR